MTRTIRPDSDHQRLVTILVHGAYALLSNIAHNTDPDCSDSKWAHRIAFTTALGKSETGQLRRIAKDRIVDFAESIDDIFIAYEALHDESEGAGKGDAVAVGVYYFEEHDENADYEW